METLYYLQLLFDHVLILIVQIEWGQYISFAYKIAVTLDNLGCCMETVFYCLNFGLYLNNFNFYVMGKKCVVFIV